MPAFYHTPEVKTHPLTVDDINDIISGTADFLFSLDTHSSYILYLEYDQFTERKMISEEHLGLDQIADSEVGPNVIHHDWSSPVEDNIKLMRKFLDEDRGYPLMLMVVGNEEFQELERHLYFMHGNNSGGYRMGETHSILTIRHEIDNVIKNAFSCADAGATLDHMVKITQAAGGIVDLPEVKHDEPIKDGKVTFNIHTFLDVLTAAYKAGSGN